MLPGGRGHGGLGHVDTSEDAVETIGAQPGRVARQGTGQPPGVVALATPDIESRPADVIWGGDQPSNDIVEAVADPLVGAGRQEAPTSAHHLTAVARGTAPAPPAEQVDVSLTGHVEGMPLRALPASAAFLYHLKACA